MVHISLQIRRGDCDVECQGHKQQTTKVWR